MHKEGGRYDRAIENKEPRATYVVSSSDWQCGSNHIDCANRVEIIKPYLTTGVDLNHVILAVLSVFAFFRIILKPAV